jgi:rhodanese-related sulfurtransferase
VDGLTTDNGLSSPLLLDVRTPQEVALGHIPGAVNIPVDDLHARLAEVPRDRPIIAYCQVGQRGYLATRILLHAGYQASNLGGGYKSYQLFHLKPKQP